MEFDFPEPEIYLINALLPDRTENENRFIQIEIDFTYTTRSRLTKLLKYLAYLKKSNETEKLEPILLFIRNLDEDWKDIYENSRKLTKKKFDQLIIFDEYWERHNDYSGI